MKSLAATVLLVLGTALAEDDLAALVRDLGSDDFATRDAATARLTEIGEPARELLEQARSTGDAEVQMRAGRILAILDVRRRIETEYEAARKAFAGDSAEDAARRVWLEVLHAVARGDDEALAPRFARRRPPPGVWASARHSPLSAIADLGWVEVIPSRRLGWLAADVGPNDVMVMAALPESIPGQEPLPDTFAKEPRALVLQPEGASWTVRSVPSAQALVAAEYDDLARSESQKREWEAGRQTVQVLGSQRFGTGLYGWAQTLDGVGDFEGALGAFERCQPTGVWPDYCIVHRYFDLMRLGRRGDAAAVLREEAGGGPCEYIGKVIRWLRGEVKPDELLADAEGQGSYAQESIHYYLGMERLLAGDVEAARTHLSRCAENGGGCYEQTFAADALWLMEGPEERGQQPPEGH